MTGREASRRVGLVHAEVDLSTPTVHRRVEALLPDLRDAGRTSPQDSVVPAPELLGELAATGLLGMLQPTRHGGRDADPAEFFRMVREVAGACASTGWLVAALGVNAWCAALLDERAQADLWGGDANALVASSWAPGGRVRRCGEVVHLSGTRQQCVGAGVAGWVLLGAVEVDPAGQVVDAVVALVERGALRGGRSRADVGLRRTAALDLVAEDLELPTHGLARTWDLRAGRQGGVEVGTGTPVAPLHRMPWGAMLGQAGAAPLLGAAAGVLDEVLASSREVLSLSLGGLGGGLARLQEVLARAAGDVEASVLQTDHDLAELHRLVRAGREPDRLLRHRVRRNQVLAVERVLAAVELVFAERWLVPDDVRPRLEQVWCDLHAGSRHRAN